MLFSIVVIQFTFPPIVYPFSISLPTFVVVCVLDDSHSDRTEVET
jgi:hypothetical protein